MLKLRLTITTEEKSLVLDDVRVIKWGNSYLEVVYRDDKQNVYDLFPTVHVKDLALVIYLNETGRIVNPKKETDNDRPF